MPHSVLQWFMNSTGSFHPRCDAARGQRVRYNLTEAGIETLPIIYALGCWGLDWRRGTPQLRARQELMRQQGPAFVEELMDELRTRHLDQRRPHDDRPLPSERLQAAYSAASLDGGTVG